MLMIVSPANYNTPQQIVIGGEVAAVEKAEELLQAAGTSAGVFITATIFPLPVGAASLINCPRL
jgi:malonyl CoA-acyl carrier protein transacylase